MVKAFMAFSSRRSSFRRSRFGTWASGRTRTSGRSAQSKSPLPYSTRGTLLSRGEAAFFHVLSEVASGQWLVMCKVRLADIVTCKERDWFQGHGGAISQKHIDFVLCSPKDSAIVLAIELDDRSHLAPDRKRRDKFLDDVLVSAGIRLLRIRARSVYQGFLLERLLSTALELSPSELLHWNREHGKPLRKASSARSRRFITPGNNHSSR